MTPKEFAKFVARDLACYHCGSTGTDLVPQHRANRGMGGSLKRGKDANNVIVLCSEANQRLESEAVFAQLGRTWGWKLNSWDSTTQPVYEAHSGLWWHLDGYKRFALPPEPH